MTEQRCGIPVLLRLFLRSSSIHLLSRFLILPESLTEAVPELDPSLT